MFQVDLMLYQYFQLFCVLTGQTFKSSPFRDDLYNELKKTGAGVLLLNQT
jgi:hypothetical protein